MRHICVLVVKHCHRGSFSSTVGVVVKAVCDPTVEVVRATADPLSGQGTLPTPVGKSHNI